MDQMERIEHMKRHLNDLKELNTKLDKMIEQEKELNAKLDVIIEQQNDPERKELTKNQISEIVNDPWED